MVQFISCGDDYIHATDNRNYKTAGNDVQYEIVVNDDTLCLYYQCSMSKADWLANFDFLPKKVILSKKRAKENLPVDCIYVHRGLWKAFYSAWTTIYQELIAEVKKGNIRHILFSGHSFGGAMAVLSVAMWARQTLFDKCINGLSTAKVYLETWGTPKVFFTKGSLYNFSYCYNGYFMYVIRNDLVTMVPPFYKKYPLVRKVGEPFNLFKMLKNIEYYHTSYDEIEDQ